MNSSMSNPLRQAAFQIMSRFGVPLTSYDIDKMLESERLAAAHDRMRAFREYKMSHRARVQQRKNKRKK